MKSSCLPCFLVVMHGLTLMLLGANSLHAGDTATKTKDKVQVYHFMDWNDVEKGRVVPIYDPARLTDEAKTNLAKRAEVWNVETRTGKHGTRQYHIAHGVRITVEKATKTPRWLLPDQPWERDITGGNVIFEQGRFRCWYSATMPKQKVGIVYAEEGRGMETNGSSTCYAESVDGLHWTRPVIGIFGFNGSLSNNIVSPIWLDSPFRDEHGTVDQRYKAFSFDELPDVPKDAGLLSKYGLYGVVSPDGYHWTRLPNPLVRHFADTWNIAAWDTLRKKYIGYFRGHMGGRSVTRSEADDFEHWPMPQTVLCAGPEEPPTVDYYSSGYTTYPGEPAIRLIFAGIYHLDTSQVDVRLAVSRDGEGWNWVSSEPIIQCGAKGKWDCGMIFGQPNLVRLPDGTLALPYSGYNEGHETSFSAVYKDAPHKETGIAWATWPDGRLAGIEADHTGDFYAANTARDIASIEINARSSSRGRVEVELVQKDLVLPGFSFADCIPFKGDELHAPVRWKGKSDLSELRGKKYQLHFRLTKAKIFGYRTITARGVTSPDKGNSK